MYFLPIGLLDQGAGLATRSGSHRAGRRDFPDLTWGNAVFDNLLPVTIGNIIGGAVMVGLVYWLVYRRPAHTPA